MQENQVQVGRPAVAVTCNLAKADHRLMVLQRPGNVTEAVWEEDPFASVEKDHALPVPEMETRGTYVIMYP